MILTISFTSIIIALSIFIKHPPTTSHPLVHALTLILPQTQQTRTIIPITEIKEDGADGGDNEYKVTWFCS